MPVSGVTNLNIQDPNPVLTLNSMIGAITLVAGANVQIIQTPSTLTFSSTTFVSSIDLVPPAEFTASGGPITTSGALTLTKVPQSANTFWAGPTVGGAAVPSFRSIVVADIPTLNQNTTGTSSNVTGMVAVNHGGSGVTTVAGARTAFGVTAGAQVVTSGTTWTTPASITTLTQFKIVLIGGGGGGGGMNTTNGHSCGGGGGGVGLLYISGLTPSTVYNITIGAAGAQGSNTPAAGGNAGNTTLTVGATTYTANGGAGGAATVNTPAGGLGGTAVNCTVNIQGQNGGGSTATGSQGIQGSGGSSGLGWGLGGVGWVSFIGPDGFGGSGFGGGGSGTSGLAGIGGAGSQGAIVIEYWN